MGEFFDKYKNAPADILFNQTGATDFYNGRVWCGDCLKVMSGFSVNSVDMILTDAPYGIANDNKITKSKNSKFKKPLTVSHDFGAWDRFDSFEEFLNFTYSWVDLCCSVLKPGGVFITFFDRDKINFLSHYVQNKYGFKCKGYFAFIKTNPVPQARKVKFMNAWEEAGIWQKPGGKLTFNYQNGQQPDYMLLPICAGHERTNHPTQKPLKLLYPLIRYFSNPGDLILDPFAGSGTTAVACRNLDRRFWAIEEKPEYCALIHQRLTDFNLRRQETVQNLSLIHI